MLSQLQQLPREVREVDATVEEAADWEAEELTRLSSHVVGIADFWEEAHPDPPAYLG